MTSSDLRHGPERFASIVSRAPKNSEPLLRRAATNRYKRLKSRVDLFAHAIGADLPLPFQ